MSWLGKLLGGAFGFMLGGPLGAILGASVGHHFDQGLALGDQDERLGADAQVRVQSAFFTATFSVMGHIAKADGRVSPAEIELAKQVMANMRLTAEQRKIAISLFQQGKSPAFPLPDVLMQLQSECHRYTHLMRMFLEIQVQAALADGDLSREKDRLLLTICHHLGVTRFEYERLKLQLLAQQRFYSYSSGHYQQPARPQHKVADAYAILGVDANASDAEIKKAYRRLISQHHPDKLVAKGLPQEMMTLAKEKTQQIRKAYETIVEARGL
ncbi:MAG: co-chaperone DjlA [Gammaproteobacteria bacterium HGW-Gammaproteobacteria-3]|nr:MAG: co-chaperone DjlA [Gammaproteobacteria bacterium HGW-Gammaproteobacteria-3]